jgi:hypothetical protein
MGALLGKSVIHTTIESSFLGPLIPQRDVKPFLATLAPERIAKNCIDPTGKLFFVVTAGIVRHCI